MVKQLTETQEQLHRDLRQDILQPLKDKMILKLECTKRETILNNPVVSRSELRWDISELERCISLLGVIVGVQRYATCHTSVVATGKEGSAPGELNDPGAIDE